MKQEKVTVSLVEIYDKGYTQALKDVGELLEAYYITGHLNSTVTEWFIEAIKRGEMPKGTN